MTGGLWVAAAGAGSEGRDPYHRSIKQLLASVVLRLARYDVVGTAPSAPVSVLVAAPHTSNWDFILMLAMAWRSGLSPVWLGKKEMFWGPLRPLYRRLGGVPVDRENPAGLVDSIVSSAKQGARMSIVIPPEGTRAKGTYWKSGFRRIAAGAEIPIVLSYLDGPTRTGGFGPTFFATDDVVADMDIVRAFYADKHGVRPSRFTPPLLREESEAVEVA